MNQNIIEGRTVSATMEREVSKNIFLVAPGVWRMKDVFVNVIIIQNSHSSNWILVDTGVQSSSSKIKKFIATVLEPGASPMAIVMTHGHFDHRGGLLQLANEWQVPVYTHKLEMPYLTGRSSYPPADSTVGGGGLASLAFLYPNKPINVAEYLNELPANHTIPGIPEWKWIHTPGHISLYRENDGVLVAGDACVTTNQESVFSVMTQKKELHGPPKYFTPDWAAAARSVKELAALEPSVVITGHGHALYGAAVRKGLHKLAKKFWQLAMPASGRYVKEAALFNDEGVTYLPPAQKNYRLIAVASASALILAGLLLYNGKQKKLGKALVGTSLKLLTKSLKKVAF